MPHYGGGSPSPRRYGGGPAQPNRPMLQVVWESLANQRGSAYDQVWPPRTLVGIENMAFARAITYDLYGANERVANNFLPAKMWALLPRWETIFNVPPLPGDAPGTRRARVAAAFARIGQPNSVQPFMDLLAATLGPIFVGVTHQTPDTAVTWWPGLSGTAGAVSSAAGGSSFVITGLTSASPAGISGAAYGQTLTLANCAHAQNKGDKIILSVDSPTGVHALMPGGIASDFGIGGTSLAPTIQWSITNPSSYWSSTVDMVGIQVDPTVAGYHNPDGTVNGAFWQALNLCSQQLDSFLPSWITWNFWIASPQNPGVGHMGFYLDEPDLDLEALDS